MTAFPHPDTGEALDTPEAFRDALIAVDAEIQEAAGRLYARRRALREALAERFPAELPERRARTAKQEEVAACPRCGGRLDESNRLRELVDEARPYMEAANTGAGPVEDWLRRSSDEAS